MNFYRVHFLRMLFLSFSLFCFNKILSNPDNNVKITGTFNESFLDFLNEVSKTNNITFFYQSEWFNSITINKTFENASLTAVLENILHESQYKFYYIQPDIIVFLPKKEVLNIFGKSSYQSNETDKNIQVVGRLEDIGKVKKPEMRGLVVDGKTGEPIIGATILVQNTTLGSVTDVKGKYVLALTPGVYNLVVSSVGFEAKTYTIKLIGNGNLNFELFDQSIKLDEVIISAQKADKNVKSNQMSIIELDRKTLKQLPSLFGEKDVIKSLTMMPGVSSVGEFGSGINVRGGSSDQNLFLMEGSPVFNSSHVFGLISVINPDAVNNVTLFKGYIPQNYGERVSSVMDVQLKEGNFKKVHANGGIGLLDGRLMVEGPVINDKASLIISARTTYSDWLLKRMPDIDLRNSSARFYDINCTFSMIANTKNKITLFGYLSNDYFKYSDQLKYNYSNYLGSLAWDHKYTSEMNSKMMYSFSKYAINKDAIDTKSEKNRVATGINYNSLKLDFNYNPFASTGINFGTQIIYYLNNPGTQTPLDSFSSIQYKKIHDEKAIEAAVYLGGRYDLTSKISIQAGIRTSEYLYLGPNQIIQYQQGLTKTENSVLGIKDYGNEIIKQYFNLEPRASLKFLITETNSFKLSYNQNVQYLNLVSYTSIPTPDDVWKLASPYILPIKCHQFAFGYFQNFKNNAFETSVELYYKKLSNLIEYKNGVNISMNGALETGLMNAKGSNYGIEFLVKKNVGEVDGWISYTYSRSLKQTYSSYTEEQINGNKVYPSAYDRPSDLIIMGTYHYNKRIRLSFNYNYSTGRPVTLPEEIFKLDGQQYVQYSDRNKYRLPDYKRLDLSLSIDETLYHKRKWKGSWTISVINVFGNQNIYSAIYNSTGLYKLLIIDRQLPTLTYNFIF